MISNYISDSSSASSSASCRLLQLGDAMLDCVVDDVLDLQVDDVVNDGVSVRIGEVARITVLPRIESRESI